MTQADREFLERFFSAHWYRDDMDPSDIARAVKLVCAGISRALSYEPPPQPVVVHNRTVLIPHHDYEINDAGELRIKLPLQSDDIIRVIRFDAGPTERYYSVDEVTVDV